MRRLFAILVCFMAVSAMATTAMAAADFGLKGIGVRVGVVEPENLDTTVGFGSPCRGRLSIRLSALV